MTTVPPDGPGTPEGDNEPPPLTEADLEKFMAELGTTPQSEADPEARYLEQADGFDVPADATGSGPVPADDPDAAAGERSARGTGSGEEEQRYALVFTPVASAKDLAKLCAVARISVVVVPSETGAIAARPIAPPAPTTDWDISELLGGGADGAPGSPGEDGTGGPGGAESADEFTSELPAEAAQLAADLTALIPFPVVVLVARLATDVGLEAGLSGHVTAVRYERGQAVGTVSPGLLLAQADAVAEDLVLGRVRPEDVRGALRSDDVDTSRRGFFGRRRKGDDRGATPGAGGPEGAGGAEGPEGAEGDDTAGGSTSWGGR